MYKIEAVRPEAQQHPSSSLIRPAELPKDPALKEICDEVIDRLKYAFAATALHPDRVAREDVLFRRFLDSRSPKAREGYQARAASLFRSAEAERRATLGRYATVSVDDFARRGSSGLPTLASPGVQADAGAVDGALRSLLAEHLVRPHEADHALHQTIGKIDPHVLSALARVPHGSTPPPPNPSGGPSLKLKLDPDVIRGAGYHKLGLFLTSVRCLVENEKSADEIGMGGVIVRPDGTTSVRNPFMVSDNMGNGEGEQNLFKFGGEGKLFAEWDLVIPGPHRLPDTWPTYYGAIISLVEKDGGGFDVFLKAVWDKVGAAVTDWIEKKVSDWAGGGEGGSVLGKIVAAIVGEFVGWLITLFSDDDDIFGVWTANLYLGAMTESYYEWARLIGPANSFNADFYGKGLYRAQFHFKVYK